MKKIMILLLFSITAFQAGVFAQAPFSQTASNPTGAITNTSVDTMTYTLQRSANIVSIQPVVTKATGTMAGWAVLDFSVNGTSWKIGTDTLALTNVASQTTVWDKTTAARFFRIRVGGATTVTGAASAKIETFR